MRGGKSPMPFAKPKCAGSNLLIASWALTCHADLSIFKEAMQKMIVHGGRQPSRADSDQ